MSTLHGSPRLSASTAIPESEQAIRHRKATESVVAALQAEGFTSLSPGLAAIIAEHVKSATRSIPAHELANMSPGSGALGIAASSGVGALLSSLSAEQRDALKAGQAPDSTVTQRVALELGKRLAAMRGSGEFGQSGTMRYGNLPASADANVAKMQSLARELGVGWAANNPDLMRLGPAAIQTLAQAKIKEESYKAAKDVGFSDRDNLAAVKWALKNGKDGNDVLKNMADSVRIFGGNDPAEQDRWRKLFNNYHDKPNDPMARQEMDAALKREEAHEDPKHREQARKTREILKLEAKTAQELKVEQGKTVAEQQTAAMKEQKATQGETKLATNIDDEWGESKAPAGTKPDAQKPGEGQKQPERPLRGKTKVTQAATPKAGA